MRLKELALYLEINDLKDIFIGPEDEWFRPIFQCCTPEDVIQIFQLDGIVKTPFKQKGIYIPNVDVKLLFEYGDTDFAAELFEEKGITPFNDLFFASFCLYHEEGHYIDFETSGLSVEDFIKRDLEEKQRVNLYLKHLSTIPDDDPDKEMMSHFYNFQYNNMKVEEIANDYACKKIIANYEKIQSFNHV